MIKNIALFIASFFFFLNKLGQLLLPPLQSEQSYEYNHKNNRSLWHSPHVEWAIE